MSGFPMRNRSLWSSLCVSAMMLVAVLTGVYSTMVEPMQTNFVTATRTTEGMTHSEKPYAYTWTAMTVTTVRTVTSHIISSSYGACPTGYEFYHSIELVDRPYGQVTVTWHNVCIPAITSCEYAYCGVNTYYYPTPYRVSVSTFIFSLSSRTLTLASTWLSRSVIMFPVTVTESYNRTVPNPQKLNLQILTVALFVVGVIGIALAIRHSRTSERNQTSKKMPSL